MAGTMLGDTAPNLVQEDVKFGFIRKLRWVATIGATGACTLVAANSSTGVTITRTSTGLYAITFPPHGVKKLGMTGSIENDDGTPTANDAALVRGAAISLSAGTGNILTTTENGGTVADPTSGTTLYFWMDIGCGT